MDVEQSTRKFLASKTDDTNTFLRLDTRHTESSETEHTGSFLRPKRKIPNFFLCSKTTLETKAFIRLKRQITTLFYVVYVCCSRLGQLKMVVLLQLESRNSENTRGVLNF